jgi:hypothetical protein
MGLDFNNFCMEQLERELSAAEAEMDDADDKALRARISHKPGPFIKLMSCNRLPLTRPMSLHNRVLNSLTIQRYLFLMDQVETGWMSKSMGLSSTKR